MSAPAPTPTARRSALGPTILVLLAIAGVLYVIAQIWTEVLWFDQLGFERVFWTEWFAKAAMFGIGFLVMAIAVGLLVWLAYRARSAYVPLTESARNLEPYQRQIEPYKRWFLLAAMVIPGLFFGSSMAGQWQTVLLWLNGSDFGQVDPQFNMDVSFYVFSLPFFQLVASGLLTVLIVSGIAAAGVYFLYGGVTFTPKFSIAKPARIHLAVVGSLIALVVAVNYWLDRYALIIAQNSERFSGAGYADVNALMPAKAIMAGIAIVVALSFLVAAIKNWWRVPVVAIALMIVSSLVVGMGYPAFVQRFQVDPNAVERESEFIQRNINATRVAYGIDGIETERYTARTDTEPGQLREDSESTASIRLLDPTIVDQTFRQYQQSRQYFDFANQLAVDRYKVGEDVHDTVIAVRELNQGGLDSDQRTWVNDHTVYTHGFGVVAAYGNRTAVDGRPVFWEQGIPSSGLMGEYEQRVYFGQNSPDYSIVGSPEGTEGWEFDYPDDSAENQYLSYTFEGEGGPDIGNLFNKILFAIKFQSFNILFSDRVTSESQILFNRDPVERVNSVAPFLTLDHNPYPAVIDRDDDPDTPKELVWIVDGYTVSNSYPYSARQTLTEATATSQNVEMQMFAPVSEINYIRNSVKAIVNAYDGSVTLYEWDSDPVLDAWKGVFPGIITPTEEISGDLMAHMRYPEDMFSAQRQILSRYHVTNPSSFYSGNDFWQVPSDPNSGENVNYPQPPYYMTLRMPTQDSAAFSLTSAFILGGQTGRQILTGFLAADGDAGSESGKIADSYGQLRLLELPRDLTMPGPGQVQNIFNANPEVSRELNLLQQQASQVLRGNLLTLPVGGGLLYVQPVYTQSSTGTQVPLLHRVLVAFGEKVGFAATLDEALNQVFEGDSGAETGDSGTRPDDEGETPSVGTAEEQLRDALTRASQAISDSEAALALGDWTAYGRAQAALDAALQDAITAEAEISGEDPVNVEPEPEAELPLEGDAPTEGTEGTEG